MAKIILGIKHHESGQLAKAEDIYRQILSADPNHFEALHWLGVIAHQMGNNDAAVELITKAININNADPKYYSHLGMAFRGLKKFDDAISCFQRAIAMNPSFAEAYNNMGNVFQLQCRFDDAIKCFYKAKKINPLMAEPIKNIGDVYRKKNKLDKAFFYYKKINLISSDSFIAHDAALSCAILLYLKNDLNTARKELKVAVGMLDSISHAAQDSAKYCHYLGFLLNWWANEGNKASSPGTADTLYVVGESHSLSLQNIVVSSSLGDFRCQAKWVEGCKQWHLANNEKNIHKFQISEIFNSLPIGSTVLLTIGEIDCRIDSGVYPVWKKTKGSLIEIVDATVNGYLDFVQTLAIPRNLRLIICGIPASNALLGYVSKEVAAQFGEVLCLFNEFLKRSVLVRGVCFLDVFAMTNSAGGFADGTLHLDSNHLRPDSMKNAFPEYLIIPKNSNLNVQRSKISMTTITIDNIEYDTDKLSDEAKAQLISLQFCDQELQRLQAQAAAIQTARMAYAKALQSALPSMPLGDTLKFN